MTTETALTKKCGVFGDFDHLSKLGLNWIFD